MTSQIIELSTFNSKEINSNNSRWSNQFPPVVVNTGDIVQMKSGFIDTNQSNTFGNILLEKDTIVHIEFGYYIHYIDDYELYPFNDGSPATPAPTYLPNYEPHIARTKHVVGGTTRYDPIIGRKTILIDAGSYSPSVLSEKISGSLSNVPNQSLPQFISNPNEFLKASYGDLELVCEDIPITHQDQIINDFNTKIIPVSEELWAAFQTVGTEVIVYGKINVGKEPIFSWNDTISYSDQPNGEFQVTTGFKYPYVVPEPNLIVLTDIVIKLRTNPVLLATSFYSLFDDNKFITIGDATNIIDRFFGASRVSLIYNDEDKRFAWDYLHSPYYNTANSVTSEAVGFQASLNMVDSVSGIFFTKLEPVSFWADILGFDMDTIIPNVEINSGMTLIRGETITSNYFALTNMFNHANTMDIPTTAIFSESDNTQQIKAVNDYKTSVDGGYYLVSIDGLYTNYKQDDHERHNINAIVSRQYNENGFISDWGEGGLRYVNTGEPFNLGSLTTTIMNPITKEPVKNLGKNSSIFIEVIHVEQQQEPEKKK